ncbi:delta(14)-sterol reductase LBR [Aplochiton taeniatus]
MSSVKYQSGDMVMGRWPGSSLYYEVTVQGYQAKSQLYTVVYKDGTELELREADIKSATGFRQAARRSSRSRSRSPSRRSSRSRSPARTARRSSSRTATVVETPLAAVHRDTKLKEVLEVRLSPLPLQQVKPVENNSNNKHERTEEGDTANKVNEKAAEPEPEKNQSRYNLRRRRDDGDARPAEVQKVEGAAPQSKVATPVPAAPAPLDFGGRIGAYFWLLFLPSMVSFLLLMCGLEDPRLANFPPPVPQLESLWDRRACGLVLLWILFQALLYVLPVGKLSEGMPLKNGTVLQYRTNGFFALTLSALAVGVAMHQEVDLTYIHSHFLQLTAVTFLLAVLLSVFLYVRARRAPLDQLASGGSSGYVVYDFWKGRELNPRIKNFDLKFFCEMRPGLIGWCLVNFAMALAEMKLQKLDSPSPAMILVNCFQLLYVADGLWNEEAILTTMDLMHDGFGFMLAFGDLVWVPFTYSLQAYYLVSHPNPLSTPALVAIVAIKALGFYIFRSSNSQKNAFRRNPSDPKLAHLKTIPTATGKSLLVSGWWGVVRHPNYLGDLIMAVAWSLTCGFNHLLPHYYLIYFIMLLVHRNSRDTSECRRKYGSAWEEYCRTVRYRIIPGVY